MCKGELDDWLNGNMQDLGAEFNDNNLSNTHNYKIGNSYLHFFANIKDLEHIRNIKRSENGDFYVGLFDIPAIKLLPHMGKGFYETRGYDVNFEKVREFAIPSIDMKPEYLLYYMKDQKRDLQPKHIKAEVHKAILKDKHSKIKRCSPTELNVLEENRCFTLEKEQECFSKGVSDSKTEDNCQ